MASSSSAPPPGGGPPVAATLRSKGWTVEACWKRAYELCRWVAPETVAGVEAEFWAEPLEGSLEIMNEKSIHANGIEPENPQPELWRDHSTRVKFGCTRFVRSRAEDGDGVMEFRNLFRPAIVEFLLERTPRLRDGIDVSVLLLRV